MDRSMLFLPVKDVFKGLLQGKAADKSGNKSKQTPKPKTESLKGARFRLEGTISRGKRTEYSVAGEDVVLDPETWVFGHMRHGSFAQVQGLYGTEGERIARKVVIK